MTLLGTPNVGYYDRFANPAMGHSANQNWMQILLNPGVAMQAPEFNELQSIFRSQFAGLANKLFADGTFLTGGNITSVFDGTDYTVTITAGTLYAYGFIHNVPEQVISITGTGTETVQLVITDLIVTGNSGLTVPGFTVEYDAQLLDPVTGSENEGYFGADRLNFTYTVERNSPGDGPTIATFDNGQLVVVAQTLSLAQLLSLLQTYFYETLGSYIAVEPSLVFTDEAALTTNPTNIELTVTGGTGYVQGVRYLNTSAVLQVLRPMTGQVQNNEFHTYTTGAKLFSTFENPILSVESITGSRQSSSLTITKGVGLSTDNIPSLYHPVTSIVSVSQGMTTYVQGTDYEQTGNAVQWIGSSRPANGTTYNVVVQYEYSLVQAVRTLTSVSTESHSYSGTTMTLSNADLQSITTLYNSTTHTTLVLGTDFSIAYNTGVVTFINPQTSGNVIQATYAYWAHTVEGDFVSRDSFVNGSSVVQYFLTPTKTPSGLTVNYLNQFSLDTTSGTTYLNSTLLIITYNFTIGRIDYLAWHNDGTLRILQGTPSQNPVPPSFTSADVPIFALNVPAEAIAANVTTTQYGNLAVYETVLNTFEAQIQTINGEIVGIDSNIATLFAGIPYFVIDLSVSDTPYALSNLYAVYCVDASGGNVEIDLPQMISGFRANIVVVKTDSSINTVTVKAYSGQTILGNSTAVINNQWSGVTVYPDSVHNNWVSTSGISQNFGDQTNNRPMPTSGTLSGNYYTAGNWTQTGSITINGPLAAYFGGNVTFNGAVTVNPNTNAGIGSSEKSMIGGASTWSGGAGGSNGGQGGAGGGAYSNYNGGGSRCAYDPDTQLGGSAGGGTGSNGYGGQGGGGVYLEAVGNINLNSGTLFHADGNDGGAIAWGPGGGNNGGGGGSGGTIEMRSLGNVTIHSGATMTADGGDAGTNAGSNDGGNGGGAGGYIRLRGNSVTNSGTVSVAGGALSAGNGTGANGSNGSTGVFDTANVIWGHRSF